MKPTLFVWQFRVVPIADKVLSVHEQAEFEQTALHYKTHDMSVAAETSYGAMDSIRVLMKKRPLWTYDVVSLKRKDKLECLAVGGGKP